MIQFVQEGGYVLLLNMLFGLGGLIVAAITAQRPSIARLAVCESAQRTVLFTTLAGFAVGVGQCFSAVGLSLTLPQFKDQPDMWKRIAFEGTSEALTNPIMGFALLGLIALLTTVGKMRLPSV